MADLQVSTCPNCGSPLDVKPGDKKVKCAYCGSIITVNEHENSTPEFPQFILKIEDRGPHEQATYDQTAQALETAGKVATGVALSSVLVPIIIAVVVMCMVGGILFAVFGNVGSALKSIQVLPTSTAVTLRTPYPTDTPRPTPTEEPTATSIPTPIPFTNVLFQDDFSDPNSGWDVVHETDYILEYQNGAFHAYIGAQNGGQSFWVKDGFTDMSVQVQATQTNGPEDALVGVSCRYTQGAGGYSFEFSRDGTYGIYVYDQGSATALDENYSDPNTVNADGSNLIEGICEGTTLTLLLNGVPLMQVSDGTYSSGGAGLIVRTGYSGEAGIDELFNQFVVMGP
jgi:LSD1 subclass zinc finger protein